MTVPPTTLRRIATTFAQTFAMVAIATSTTWFHSSESRPTLLAVVLIIPTLLSFVPLIANPERIERLKSEQIRKRGLWRESYRHSPEANLLNLHD